MKPRSSARFAWSLWTGFLALAVAAFILGRRNSSQIDQLFMAAPFLYLTVGAMVASRRPSNPVGWILCAVGFVPGLYTFAREYGRYALLTSPGTIPGGDVMAWLSTWITLPVVTMGATFLLLLFPDGRLPSRRWRPVARVAAGAIALFTIGPALTPGTLEGFEPHTNPFGVEAFGAADEGAWLLLFSLFPILAIASVSSVVVRFRRSRGPERQQLKWFLFACATTLVLIPLLRFGALPIPRLPDFVFFIMTIALLSLIPISVGVAILRYRLYEIDVVINKTVVYGGLAAFITAVYVGVVVGIGTLVGAGDKPNLGLSLAATAIVAVAFQPARERVQRFANRLVYGERVTPYEAITGFSHRMAESLSLDSVLPQMAEAAAKGVGGIRSRVKLSLPGGGEQVVTWPDGSSENSFDRTLAVMHQGEQVGEISVSKAPGEQITKNEDALLADLASQAGLAMRNLRLTGELQQKLIELQESRKRIVAAQDEERRRMERDIHDGAQQQLVAMAVKLGLARNLLTKDRERAGALLDDLKGETHVALETLRDLARGLFPEILVERGLVAALEAHERKTGIDAPIEDSIGAARFDLEVEASVYFCIREALQNATKHAPGAPITITLAERDGQLEFWVKDQGPGFDPNRVQLGSGLQNMADRIEALGGTFEIESALGRETEIRGQISAKALEAAQ